MDTKQFDEFQTAIQWVVDERRRREAEVWEDTPLEHRQEYWGIGETQAGRVRGVFPSDRSVEVWQPVCATGCCVAGNIVLAHGDRFVVPATCVNALRTVTVEACLDEDGVVHTISMRARYLAGIGATEAGALFKQDNSADTIVAIATIIARSHGHELQVIE